MGNDTINSSLVERGRPLMDPQPHPSCTSSSELKLTFTNVILQFGNISTLKYWLIAIYRKLKLALVP